MVNTVDNGGWTIVQKDKGNNKRTAKSRRYKASKQNLDKPDFCDSVEIVSSRLENCLKYLQKSQFHEDFCKRWKEDKSKIIVDEIVCYGIGSFSQKSNFSGPLWQMAFGLALRSFLEKEQNKSQTKKLSMVYYDPLVTCTERQVLQEKYNIRVLKTNERGIHGANMELDFNTILFYMPHCPKGLYENVLWSNWNVLAQNRRAVFILGNSLRTYVERANEARINDATILPSSCLEQAQPFLKEHWLECSKHDMQNMPGHFEAAFNDMFLTRFYDTSEEKAERKEWPERLFEPSQDGQDEVL